MFSFYNFFKNFAFALDPESAHEKSLAFLSSFPLVASEIFSAPEKKYDYSTSISGMKWTFPIGLAAGLDKNAVAIDFFSRLGFGAIEIGTVTP